MARLILKNLWKRFEKFIAVNDFNLEIDDGEFIVLVGPSGCGKSTTLKMVAGLEEVSEGNIYIGDRNVTHLEPKDRNIAMVFQNYALYPHMDVYRNLSFGLKIRGVEGGEIRKRVDRASKILGIEELLGRKPRQLSGGQMQRVALGRAIVREPDLFLFDEPLSNLDAKLRVKMRVEISRLHNELRSTTVYVTHDQVEAMTLGDRIVVMKDGVVNQVGTPLEVYDFPANRFVAGFIGSPEMNFIEGSLSQDGGKGIFLSENRAIRIDLGPVELLRNPEGKVTLGVRPEHLRFAPESESSNRLRVEVIEHLGFQTLVMGKAGDLSITALVDRTESMKYGMNLAVTVNPNHIHLFDSQTGASLTRRG